MIDLNHDGKHDYKDDDFFYNVVMKDSSKETETKLSNSGTYSTGSSGSSGKVLTWFTILCIVFMVIKIIGG